FCAFCVVFNLKNLRRGSRKRAVLPNSWKFFGARGHAAGMFCSGGGHFLVFVLTARVTRAVNSQSYLRADSFDSFRGECFCNTLTRWRPDAGIPIPPPNTISFAVSFRP